MVFSRVKPKVAAYSHVILLQTKVTDLVLRTQSTYEGPLEVGEDLLRFTIGDQVVAKKWNPELRRYPD
jgi:ribonuclease Z